MCRYLVWNDRAGAETAGEVVTEVVWVRLVEAEVISVVKSWRIGVEDVGRGVEDEWAVMRKCRAGLDEMGLLVVVKLTCLLWC